MADSASFDFACGELERATVLDRLESRGTVRLALKETGLEARSVTASQMAAVMSKVLPKELTNRGVENADAICAMISEALSEMQDDVAADTPEAVFRRLGGS